MKIKNIGFIVFLKCGEKLLKSGKFEIKYFLPKEKIVRELF